MKFNVPLPIDAVVAVSYNCNARCGMCDIWKITDHSKDMALEYFTKLPSSLRFVNISGGETFMRPDIVEIVRTVRASCPRARIIISSNGFMTELIAARVREILTFEKNIGIAISIDGIGATHDRIRGIAGVFKKCMATVAALKELGVRDLRIAYTFTQDNWYDFSQVQALAKRLRVDFSCSLAQSSDNYFGGKKNNIVLRSDFVWPEFKKVMRAHLRSPHPKQWFRAYYVWGLWQLLHSRSSPLPSQAATKHFFLAPDGTVFPSVVDNIPLGNITSQDFSDIWNSSEARHARTVLHAKKSNWMVCTARTAMLSSPWALSSWIVKNKVYAHFARQ